MEYELSNKDKEVIAIELSSLEARYRTIIKKQAFNVGDVLIKKTITLDDDDVGMIASEVVQTYNESYVPERYLVIYSDIESGTFLVKQFLLSGKLDDDIYDIGATDHIQWNELSYYEVDPLIVDSILLDTGYDLKNIFSEEATRRGNIVKNKRRQAVVFSNLKAINEFIYSLKPNQIIYYHDNRMENFDSDFRREIIFKKFRKVSTNIFKKTRRGQDFKGNDKHILFFRCGFGRLYTSIDLMNQAIYLTEPPSLRE